MTEQHGDPLRAALDTLPRATCYREHTQPDEHRGVFGAVWIADVLRTLAASATDEGPWDPLVPNNQLPDGWAEGPTAAGMQRGPVARPAATDEPIGPNREALWEKFTGGEKLAYGLGYRDAEHAASARTSAEIAAKHAALRSEEPT